MFVYPAFGGPAWLPWFALASGVSVAVAAITAIRRGVRGAMVAFLCYSAAIFPALGFINLYPLRFAPVADHFGYAASAVLAPVAAWCLVRAWRAINDRGVPCAIGSALAVVLVASLAVIARGHTAKFANAETLWRTTLADNPRAWLASNNLVSMLLTSVQESLDAGDMAARDRALDEAARLAELSVELAGTIDMPVQSNMSEIRRLQGRLPESLTALDAALLLEPNAPGPHWQRGRIIELMGNFAAAEPDYARAVELSPRNGIYLREWVRWLTKSGRLREARDIAARIVAVDPGDAESIANLGALELEIGDIPAARRNLRRALTMANGPLATVIAVRCARACLAPPVDPESAMQARAIAEQLVRETDGVDPLAFVLLARAQATLGDPKARATLARADALLNDASAEVKELAVPERAATEALLSAGSPAATLSR
jgi:tetratricopeptide (TPR) repeat protein